MSDLETTSYEVTGRVARFKLAEVPASAEGVLTEIARRRGALRAGGVVDLHKASEILVHEVRSGTIGPITLEAPV